MALQYKICESLTKKWKSEFSLSAKKKLRQLFQFSLEKLQPHSGLEDLLMSTDEQELELLTGLSGFIVNICGPRRGCALVLKDEKGRSTAYKHGCNCRISIIYLSV